MIQEVRELEKENAVLKEKLNYFKQEWAKTKDDKGDLYVYINS